MRTTTARHVLDYWFDGVASDGAPGAAATQRWFQGGQAVDDEIRALFGSQVEAALGGELAAWAAEPESRLALVILLDQFTRNLFRGRARAFAGDERAFELARGCVDRGEHLEFAPIERYFLYLPYEHREERAAQKRACELYAALLTDAPEGGQASFAAALDWARRHAVVIERFGRFPSRNAALGRVSSEAELAFLAATPMGF